MCTCAQRSEDSLEESVLFDCVGPGDRTLVPLSTSLDAEGLNDSSGQVTWHVCFSLSAERSNI